MADIFLSYAREDDARAAAVARVLGELGWSVFWDRKVVPGTTWDDVLQQELTVASCVVVLWSRASVKSQWVRTEASHGHKRGILVPARLDDIDPPLQFQLLEAAQLHDWADGPNHPEFEALTEGVARHVPRPARPTVKPAPRDSDPRSFTTPTILNRPAPTPRPVPFGAPVKFLSDLWSLPDEPLLGFVEIPEGQFTMGSDKRQDAAASDAELPQHKVVLNRYYIGRYEVTVGQFRAFVQSSDYKVDATALNGAADLPVRSVSWHDAVAYSSWLDERLRQSSDVPAGVRGIMSQNGQACRVTLPSEAEWEKAARGTDGRIYPWGATLEPSRANYSGSGQGRPTPVGSYPEGASPYGLLDMSGNMCEWTRSLWGSSLDKPDFGYPYLPDDPKRDDLKAPNSVFRMVRGGSFSDFGDLVRAAYRVRFYPSVRFTYLGFRVVVSCLRS